jgi:hypothetical protein
MFTPDGLMTDGQSDGQSALDKWLLPKPPAHLPINVYSWLLDDEFDKCLDPETNRLYALPQRWHHFPVTMTEIDCLRNAYAMLGDNSNSESVKILEITMVQANLGGMELLHGTHKKSNSEYTWLVQTGNALEGNDSQHIYLTDCMYRIYPISETQYVQQITVPCSS